MRFLGVGSLVAVLTGLGLGCAGPSAPGEIGPDGLQRVRSWRVDELWVRPGFAPAADAKLRIGFGSIEYRRPNTRARGSDPVSPGGYVLSIDQADDLRRYFAEQFVRILGGSDGFPIVSEAGPGVLDVRGRAVDLVVDSSPVRQGREDLLVKRSGAMTLALEVSDAESGEVQLRLSDRRVLSRTDDRRLYQLNLVSWSADLRAAFATWARILRDELLSLRAAASGS